MTVKVGDQVMYSKDMTGDPITLDGEKYFNQRTRVVRIF